MLITTVSKHRISNVADLGTTLQMTLKSEPADSVAPELIHSSLFYDFDPIAVVNINIDLVFNEPITSAHGNIVISNGLGKGLSDKLDDALDAAGASQGQFFLNGADTETTGVDIIATWNTELLGGDFNLTAAANFTETDVVNIYTPPDSALGSIDPSDVFSEQAISIIEEWQPQNRISLTSTYQQNNWLLNLAVNRYGQYTITDGGKQTYGAEILTDIRIEHQFTQHLSWYLGVNNIFNVTPDKNKIANSHPGTIIDNQGNEIVSSAGVFKYSRRSAPFGFNGSYLYFGLNYQFN